MAWKRRAARAKDTNQDPKYFGNVLNSKTRPFAINAPRKRGSLLLSIHDLHDFTVVDFTRVTNVSASYTAGNKSAFMGE